MNYPPFVSMKCHESLLVPDCHVAQLTSLLGLRAHTEAL